MLAQIARGFAATGLTLRGAFHPSAADAAQLPQLAATGTIVLVGNAGGEFWPIFEQWRAEKGRALANPLDAWSGEVIASVAKSFGAKAVSPSDRPFLPFQQWAMRAEGLKPSPLGVLVHPEFGLWHAYRGALLFEEKLDLPSAHEQIHLCDLCDGKPCKKACPVNAHAGEGFAYVDCLAQLNRNPHGACMTGGCLDRNACPYGAKYRYPAAMQAFIARAFARA